MSHPIRLAIAVVALGGATVASAQAPGLRPVVTPPAQFQWQPQQQLQRNVRTVGTVSPVPVIVQQQQQALAAAYNNALLWRMYQPPVIVVNPYPPLPFDPWGFDARPGRYDWRTRPSRGALYNAADLFDQTNPWARW